MHHSVARRGRFLGLGAMLAATSLATGAVIATGSAPAAAASCTLASGVTSASSPSAAPRQTASVSSRRLAATAKVTKLVVKKYGKTWRATATVTSTATVLGSARAGAVYPMSATASVLVTCGASTTRVSAPGAASGSASSTASSRRAARTAVAAVAGGSSASRARTAATKLAAARAVAKATSSASVSSAAIARRAASASALAVSRSRGSAAAVNAARSALTAKVATLGVAAPAPAPAPASRFPANATFDYQIGGAYAPSSSVTVVDRDRTDSPVAGKYNVCYINAFQSQPGESGSWGSLLLRTSGGGLVQDPGWPGEYVVDTRQSAAVATFVGSWIKACAAKGFQAVELDNLDSYTRSGGLLSASNNLDVFGRLVAIGHAAGVAVGQKNTVDQSSAAKALGADFAVAEECQVYSECSGYSAVYGAAWVEIEYTDAAFASACTARGATTSVIRRDVQVVPAGSSGYVYRAC